MDDKYKTNVYKNLIHYLKYINTSSANGFTSKTSNIDSFYQKKWKFNLENDGKKNSKWLCERSIRAIWPN
jgi:hypothetical protein